MLKTSILTVSAIILAATSLLAEEAGKDLGSVKGGNFKTESAVTIIKEKCTRCHSSQRIDAALKENRNMLKIQHEMEKKGADLTEQERDVMRIYWKQNPLKQK